MFTSLPISYDIMTVSERSLLCEVNNLHYQTGTDFENLKSVTAGMHKIDGICRLLGEEWLLQILQQ